MKKIIAALIIGCFITSIFVSSGSAEAFSQQTTSRLSWGADENLRIYNTENSKPQLVSMPTDFYLRYAPELILTRLVKQTSLGEILTWPLQYSDKVTKIIIHHTATTRNLDDPTQAIRDIYYYHAISRGWGDIGYNYIIDTKGKIYEGRYGGESVVGAHAGTGNRGSVGIAVLGNYEENELSPEAYKSLVWLVSEKSKLYGIDPSGESYFRGKKLPNIFGHRDISATTCPGKNITVLMPQIRKDSAAINAGFDYAKARKEYEKNTIFEYAGPHEPVILAPDKKFEFEIKIKNTGSRVWEQSTRLNLAVNSFIENSYTMVAAFLKDLRVEPGQTGTFKVTVITKIIPGFSYISFKPVINGEVLEGEDVFVPVIIEKPYYDYEIVDMTIPKTTLKPGEKITALVTLKNTGNTIWRNFGDNRTALGTDNPRERPSAFTKSLRMGYLKQNRVSPGFNGQFVFTLTAPQEPGIYEEYFAPVIERVTWLEGKGMKFTFNVNPL